MTLDPGEKALRKERGALGNGLIGESLRDLAAAASKYSAAHPRRGSSPLFHNKDSLYPFNAFYSPADNSFQITTEVLPGAITNEPYTYQLTSINAYGDVSWSIVSGSISGFGFNFSSGGVISGTSTSNLLSGVSLTIGASDLLSNTDQKTYTFYVLDR